MFDAQQIAETTIGQLAWHLQSIHMRLFWGSEPQAEPPYSLQLHQARQSSPLREEIALLCRAANGDIDRASASEQTLGEIAETLQSIVEATAGPPLLSQYTIADAYFAPVCMRLSGYALPVSATTRAYVERVQGAPGVACGRDGLPAGRQRAARTHVGHARGRQPRRGAVAGAQQRSSLRRGVGLHDDGRMRGVQRVDDGGVRGDRRQHARAPERRRRAVVRHPRWCGRPRWRRAAGVHHRRRALSPRGNRLPPPAAVRRAQPGLPLLIDGWRRESVRAVLRGASPACMHTSP